MKTLYVLMLLVLCWLSDSYRHLSQPVRWKAPIYVKHGRPDSKASIFYIKRQPVSNQMQRSVLRSSLAPCVSSVPSSSPSLTYRFDFIPEKVVPFFHVLVVGLYFLNHMYMRASLSSTTSGRRNRTAITLLWYYVTSVLVPLAASLWLWKTKTKFDIPSQWLQPPSPTADTASPPHNLTPSSSSLSLSLAFVFSWFLLSRWLGTCLIPPISKVGQNLRWSSELQGAVREFITYLVWVLPSLYALTYSALHRSPRPLSQSLSSMWSHLATPWMRSDVPAWIILGLALSNVVSEVSVWVTWHLALRLRHWAFASRPWFRVLNHHLHLHLYGWVPRAAWIYSCFKMTSPAIIASVPSDTAAAQAMLDGCDGLSPRLWEQCLVTAIRSLLVCVLGPMWEELLHRKYVLGWLQSSRGCTKSVAVALSSIIFALHHMSPLQAPQLAFLATLWSILYLQTDLLLVPIVTHILWNCQAMYQF